ncbi:MAG: single-stranded DNA-binding protein [Ruminococcus sp.]|nr:single-stranded DNA-binding protein [Ruminococcus sp.]
MLNRVILMGRITRDLEVRQTPSGQSVLRFTVAVDRPVKSGAEKQTDFISCTAWGQQAEFISRYFGKGRMIALEGSIRTGSYDKNGQTVYTTDVNVDRVSFTGEPRQDGGNSGAYQQSGYNNNYNNQQNSYQQPQQNNYQQPQYNQPPQQNGNVSIGGMDDYEEIISDDGVPF